MGYNDKEYMLKRRNAKKAHYEVIETLRKFAKRSKFISVERTNEWWGLCRIDMRITGESKVVKEVKDYLCTFCSYYAKDEYGEWYKTAEDYAEDDWAVDFEVYVYNW